jgi:hypothetical protein
MWFFKSKQKEPVFCKDCKHCKYISSLEYAYCGLTVKTITGMDLVSGKEETHYDERDKQYCSSERKSIRRNACGKEGKHFVNKHKFD